MSYSGRYGTQAPAISGISECESDLPESCRIPAFERNPERKRRCVKCNAVLSIYNSGDKCMSHGVQRRAVKVSQENTTGLKGVVKHGDRYAAQIQVNGKKVHLGMGSTPQEAHLLWAAAKMDAQLKQWRDNGGPLRYQRKSA